MKIAILGTGTVGQTLATKLVKAGYDVTMGSRTANNAKAYEWQQSLGKKAQIGSFEDAAASADIVVNATLGTGSLEALAQAGSAALRGKVLIDVANPLDFSQGMPPSLFISNTDSLGETIQRQYPETFVVKALNTMSSEIMVTPELVPGDHKVFISGNDARAKTTVTTLLTDAFGWRPTQIVDLGGIDAARATEQLLPIWLRLWGKLGHLQFNFGVLQKNSETTKAEAWGVR